MKTLKKILSVTIILSMLMVATSCSKPAVTTPASSGNSIKLNSELLPVYERFDPENFYGNCARLEEIADSSASEEICELYDLLMADYVLLHDYNELAYYLYIEDTSNDYYQEENTYCSELLPLMKDRMCQALHTAITGPSANALKEHIGTESIVNGLMEYQPVDPEVSELIAKEKSLITEYDGIMENISSTSYTYKGTEYTYDEIFGEAGDLLYEEDEAGYFDVYSNIYRIIAEKVGPVYIETINVRNKIAECYGYDNYAEYADEVLRHRTYSIEDLNALKEATKSMGCDFVSNYYYAYYFMPEFNKTPSELLDFLDEFLVGISPVLDESWEYFLENKLYSIGNEDSRVDIGFTSEFYAFAPIIEYKQANSAIDILQMTHEMGHFTDSYYNPVEDPLFNTGNYSIMEIQSTGIELLSMYRYDKLFPEDPYTPKTYAALELLTFVSDGCIQDDFERTLYQSSDDLTVDDLNSLYLSLKEEYGEETDEGTQYSWWYVTHIFQNPLYYADYAASGFASLQIWLESLDDFDSALSKWEKAIEMGPYDYTYEEFVKALGLKTFEDSKTDEEILIKARDAAYDIFNEGVDAEETDEAA